MAELFGFCIHPGCWLCDRCVVWRCHLPSVGAFSFLCLLKGSETFQLYLAPVRLFFCSFHLCSGGHVKKHEKSSSDPLEIRVMEIPLFPPSSVYSFRAYILMSYFFWGLFFFFLLAGRSGSSFFLLPRMPNCPGDHLQDCLFLHCVILATFSKINGCKCRIHFCTLFCSIGPWIWY